MLKCILHNTGHLTRKWSDWVTVAAARRGALGSRTINLLFVFAEPAEERETCSKTFSNPGSLSRETAAESRDPLALFKSLDRGGGCSRAQYHRRLSLKFLFFSSFRVFVWVRVSFKKKPSTNHIHPAISREELN